MARLTIRIDLAKEGAIGPGKIRLLELVGETGSISAAGRAMEMSYRRAWLLIDALNHLFKTPLVATKLGGKSGGGAALTPFGRDVVRHYRALEDEAEQAVRPHLRALEAALARRKSPRRSAAETD
ncbi:MAG TPA: winged helix-turn-helix domain-containing protein [Stellaceae bacterium]|jgi:molybdate transport system regulatory protein|nr:winged helix-turn-helix domain-containing protein [Stellaceae bacterium]